jgi:hypothetical protein
MGTEEVHENVRVVSEMKQIVSFGKRDSAHRLFCASEYSQGVQMVTRKDRHARHLFLHKSPAVVINLTSDASLSRKSIYSLDGTYGTEQLEMLDKMHSTVWHRT